MAASQQDRHAAPSDSAQPHAQSTHAQSTPAQSPQERLRAAAQAALANPRPALSLPEPLHSRFLADTAAERLADLQRLSLLAVGIYIILIGVFLISLPPTILKAGIVIPQLVIPPLTSLALRLRLLAAAPTPLAREALFFANAALICLLVLWGAYYCLTPLLVIALFLSVLPVSLFLAFTGLTLPFAAALAALNIAVQLGIVIAKWPELGVYAPYPPMLMIAITLPSLLAVYRLERAQTRVYLLRLLQSLEIVDLATQNAALEALAGSDPLTGCANRRRLDQALAELGPTSPGGDALVLLNLDDFRSINTTFGHLAGDEALRATAQALRDIFAIPQNPATPTPPATDLRAGSTSKAAHLPLLARLEGNSFAILLRNTQAPEAERLARAAATALARIQLPNAPGLCLQASMGLAARGPQDNGARLMLMADAALYAAKHTGRNCLRWPPLAA